MRFAAGAVATIVVALVLNAALTMLLQFAPSEGVAGAALLAVASVFAALAFQFHPGAESIRDLPAILMVGAIIALIAIPVPQAAVSIPAGAATDAFGQAAQLALVLSEAYLGLAIAKQFIG